jgi:hypothetical protein
VERAPAIGYYSGSDEEETMATAQEPVTQPVTQPEQPAMHPDVALSVTPAAKTEVKKFMETEGVSPAVGGLRVSVQPGGCSGFKYALLIEDQSADDDFIVDQGEFRVSSIRFLPSICRA